MKLVWQPQHFNIGSSMSMNDVKSLSHSKWRCKYHIVFAPKYRRQIIYGRIKADVGKILRYLCKRKNVVIIEAECCPNHIHMLVTIPPHLSISSFMWYLKSKSSLIFIHLVGSPTVPSFDKNIISFFGLIQRLNSLYDR